MKVHKKLISTRIHDHWFAIGIFTSLFAFFFFAGGMVVANGQTLGPTDSHVVDLYVNGQSTTVPTRASTVGDFLNRANVPVYQNDLVEPSLNTPIGADNFRIQVFRAKPVTIIEGNSQQHIMSPYSGAKLIAEKAGYTIYPQDKLTLTTASNFVQGGIIGEELTIVPATPVSVSLYGAPAVTYRTQAKTVGQFLEENNIVLPHGATVTPTADTVITENMPIFISKYGETVITTEAPVAFPIDTTLDPSQLMGQVTVITPGVPGKQQIVYQVELKNGQEISRKVIQDVVTVQPQAQSQTEGTKPVDMTVDKSSWMSAAGINPSDYYYVDFIIGHESGWRTGAVNGDGCYGLGQACPGSKLVNACPSWQSDPVCQLEFFSNYANSRYGSWYLAYLAWSRQGWW